MGEIINGREAFLSRRPPVFPVDLPDMGVTVYVLKGTWGLAQLFDNLKGQIPQQLALLLVTPEGARIFTDSEEDIKALSESMTIADMLYVVEQWAQANGVSKEAMEARIKNSAASLNGDSVSV